MSEARTLMQYKHYLALILSLLYNCVPAAAQSAELLERISLQETLTRLHAEKKYDSIILLTKNIPPRDSLYLYATEGLTTEAYFATGDTANGFKLLTRAIELQVFNSVGNMRYTMKSYNLDSNKHYQYLEKHYDQLTNRYAGQMDIPVLIKCLEIFYTDQPLRNLYMFSSDTSVIGCADRLMAITDRGNVENMKTLLRDLGHYPGYMETGPSFGFVFNFIVTHLASALPQDTLYQFLRTATLAGQLPNWYGPRMLDKLEYDKQAPLIYGEFGNSDFYDEDGKYIYPEIVDVNGVDKRRAAFLLPPLYKVAQVKDSRLPPGYDIRSQKK